MQRAQTAAEYVTLLALMFVLVASLMLVSFRQQELTLALTAARLGCNDYSATTYAAYQWAANTTECSEIRYYYVGAQNVTIVPISNVLLQSEKDALQLQILKNIVSVFQPGALPSGRCYTAAYYSYCIAFP
ncbi:MAG: hypothetical protein V1835_06385 [Candidatus Micrarchaeota archaeon]